MRRTRRRAAETGTRVSDAREREDVRGADRDAADRRGREREPGRDRGAEERGVRHPRADRARAAEGGTAAGCVCDFFFFFRSVGRSIDAAAPLCAVLITLVPIRPRRRGERRSLRAFAVVSLRTPVAFNPHPRRLSTPTDAFQLHPDVRSYGTTLRATSGGCTKPSFARTDAAATSRSRRSSSSAAARPSGSPSSRGVASRSRARTRRSPR